VSWSVVENENIFSRRERLDQVLHEADECLCIQFIIPFIVQLITVYEGAKNIRFGRAEPEWQQWSAADGRPYSFVYGD